MTQLPKPLIGLNVSGGLGDQIVYSKRHRMQLVNKKAQPHDAGSPAQLSWRTMFQKTVVLWHSLSPGEKREWESRGTANHMTGYDYFVSQALRPNPGIYLPLTGGIMAGDIDMNTSKIINLPDPVADQEPVTKKYYEDNPPATANVKTLAFTKDVAVTGNVAYAGFGFQPTSLIYYYEIYPTGCNSIVDANGDCVITFNDWNFLRAYKYDNTPVYNQKGVGTIVIATFVSYDVDGFTLIWSKVGSPTGTANIIVTAFL